MKAVIAAVIGLISGFLLYMMGAMLFADFSAHSSGPPGWWVLFGFFGGTALSIWWLLRGVRSTSGVFRRGFLIGAAEWLCMAFVGVVFSGRAVSQTVAESSDAATTAGAAVGGGMVALLTGGVSIFMAVVCLIGFAIAYFMGREMRDTAGVPTRKCPECAEMIQAEARKCRHCGAVLEPGTARVGQ